jgi:hypothetical protein
MASFTAPFRERAVPPWWVPVLLAAPALIPLLASILAAPTRGLVATGFIQTDQPYYLADAREFFDEGFHLLYGNPYAGYDTPHIYFQPHLLLIGLFQQLGLDPGLTWSLFSIAGALFAALVAARLYGEVVGWRGIAPKLGLLCFFWGGGILTLAGFCYSALVGKLSVLTVLRYDPGPARGWWMLNFGRNLVYGPTEAYYHGVFLLCILFLLRRRFGPAIALAALLSLSHPFTGIECALVVLVYLVVERVIGDRSIGLGYLAGSAAVLCFHLGYYLVFLNQFADHRAVQAQFEQQGVARSWLYLPSTFLAALFIVAALAAARLWRWPGFRQTIRDPRSRLFMIWFLVIFGLTQHYRVMKPIQPIHFAHGYDWIALFLLGAPVLVTWLERLLRIGRPAGRVLATAAFLGFFLLDNVFWFSTFLGPTTPQAVLITREQRDVLAWLDGKAVPRDMVVTADPLVSYLVSTYTRARSWAGNMTSTPHYQQRALESRNAFQVGATLLAWNGMHVFYVQRSPADAGWKAPAGSSEVFRNASYAVWEFKPGRNDHPFDGGHASLPDQ